MILDLFFSLPVTSNLSACLHQISLEHVGSALWVQVHQHPLGPHNPSPGNTIEFPLAFSGSAPPPAPSPQIVEGNALQQDCSHCYAPGEDRRLPGFPRALGRKLKQPVVHKSLLPVPCPVARCTTLGPCPLGSNLPVLQALTCLPSAFPVPWDLSPLRPVSWPPQGASQASPSLG